MVQIQTRTEESEPGGLCLAPPRPSSAPTRLLVPETYDSLFYAGKPIVSRFVNDNSTHLQRERG